MEKRQKSVFAEIYSSREANEEMNLMSIKLENKSLCQTLALVYPEVELV